MCIIANARQILKQDSESVTRGYSSVGRAPALQAGCQRFESAYLHKKSETTESELVNYY